MSRTRERQRMTPSWACLPEVMILPGAPGSPGRGGNGNSYSQTSQRLHKSFPRLPVEFESLLRLDPGAKGTVMNRGGACRGPGAASGFLAPSALGGSPHSEEGLPLRRRESLPFRQAGRTLTGSPPHSHAGPLRLCLRWKSPRGRGTEAESLGGRAWSPECPQAAISWDGSGGCA